MIHLRRRGCQFWSLALDEFALLAVPALQHKTDTLIGHKIFPDIKEKIAIYTIVGPDCWSIFRILNINADFLKVPLEKWPSNEHFYKGQGKYRHLCVVNNAAERGVKLCSSAKPKREKT